MNSIKQNENLQGSKINTTMKEKACERMGETTNCGS